ncbi:putative ATPase of the PP-loop superfamily implicated in cell cycle control [Actinobacteria bacterium IMCC26207]|nr:putative ATPase of the PP-loop superfamily implicated in cell cycle control [Actinobacteria bacterium IMCC26207]
MKCVVCRESAVIDVRRANSNFCSDHFLRFCQEQMSRAIREFDMLSPTDRVLVAVSGGKDSLAVWDLLQRSGYEADGLYVGLGIDSYSDTSGDFARAFAESRGLKLIEIDLPTDYGYDIPTGARAARRAPCSACGTSKRHLFDKAALDGSYDVLVTGHNLDDEAAVLFGNVLRWQTEYLARQMPVLQARVGFPKKVKPLIRLSERDTAAYCILQGIDYMVEECPMSAGNKHLGYKEALNSIELASPGTKSDFYSGFLRKASALFRAEYLEKSQTDLNSPSVDELTYCVRCSAPSTATLCAFCRLVDKAGGSVRVEQGRFTGELEDNAAQSVRITTRAERLASGTTREVEAGQ